MTVTKAQINAALEALRAIAEAIRELKQVPSGHLYARLMGIMSLEDYNAFINKLISMGIIKQENHLLIWIEPKQ